MIVGQVDFLGRVQGLVGAERFSVRCDVLRGSRIYTPGTAPWVCRLREDERSVAVVVKVWSDDFRLVLFFGQPFSTFQRLVPKLPAVEALDGLAGRIP